MTTPPPPMRFDGLPDRLLEAYLCGELSPEERARVEAAARELPALAAWLETRRQQKAAFAERHPFSTLRPRLEPRVPVWKRRWLPGLLVPAMALLGLVVGFLSPPAERPDTVRVRGGVQVRVLVKRGEAVHEHAAGMALRAGDALRLEVADVHGGQLWVLALDARGRVTRLHGFEDTGGPVHMTPGALLLPGSLTLDDAPVQEALYVVLAGAPLAADEVEGWLVQAAAGAAFPVYPEALAGSRYAVLPLVKERE